MRTVNILFVLLASALIVASCDNNGAKESGKTQTTQKSSQSESNTDESKAEVKIGAQVWQGRNLDVDKFRNGDSIPHAKTGDEWIKAGENRQPAWCYYDNDSANGEKYGKLYNWYAVSDPRGLAPEGWRIPTSEDWIELIDFLGGKKSKDVTFKLKSKTGWDFYYNGTNETGFTALPAGSVNYYKNLQDFYHIGSRANFWTSTEYEMDQAFVVHITIVDDFVKMPIRNKLSSGYSVRCLKD